MTARIATASVSKRIGREEIVRLAPDQFVAIDIETTGGNAETDRIIEIALVGFRDGDVIHRWQTFIDPGRDIPPLITDITGITERDVIGAPPFHVVAKYVQTYMRRAGAVVAHNHQAIERRLLGAALERSGLTWPTGLREICTLKTARDLQKSGLIKSKRLRLDALCVALNVPMGQHHRAAVDAEACGHCLLAMERRMRQTPEWLCGQEELV